MKTLALSATLRRYGVAESLTGPAGRALIEAANKLDRQQALLQEALALLQEARETSNEGFFRGTANIVIERIEEELKNES